MQANSRQRSRILGHARHAYEHLLLAFNSEGDSHQLHLDYAVSGLKALAGQLGFELVRKPERGDDNGRVEHAFDGGAR